MAWPLKYGSTPHQRDGARSFPDGREWLRVLNGSLGYINVLDALRAWHLATELARAFGRPAAASVKHVHPAGAALAAPLDESFRRAQYLPDEASSPLATAYASVVHTSGLAADRAVGCGGRRPRARHDRRQAGPAAQPTITRSRSPPMRATW